MNKKVYLTIGFFALALAGVFFFTQEAEKKEAAFVTKGKLPIAKDSGESPALSQVSEPEDGKDKNLPMGASSFSGPRPLTDKEMDDIDKQIEAYEKEWDKRVEKLFLEELGLEQVDLEDYHMMRKGYEEDRLEAFEEFHERMAKEKGPHYTYSPTEEMLQFEGKLKKEYLDTFRRRFGEDAFVKYFNSLEEYNSMMREKMDPKHGILSIDF